MHINTNEYNMAMLKIARIELKERNAAIDALEREVEMAGMSVNILIASIVIMLTGIIGLLIWG